MSKLGRKLARKKAKKEYQKFGKAWRAEQRYQNGVLADGKELPEGSPRLKRKPTFGMWSAIVEAQRKGQTEKQRIEVQEFVQDVKDLDWDEQGATAPGANTVDEETTVQGEREYNQAPGQLLGPSR